MKKLKKVVALFLVLCLCSNLNLFIAYAGSDDTQPPVINSIKVDKHEVTAGDTVTVTVAASDEHSISSIEVGMRIDGVLGSGKYITLSSNGDGTYSGQLNITEKFINGEYYLEYIRLEDAVGNVNAISPSKMAYPDVKFTVINCEDDAQPPVMNYVKIDKHEVTAGDTVTVTVAASDEHSISSIEVGMRIDGVLGSGKYITLSGNGDGTYSGQLNITEKFINGEYYLEYIRLEDAVGNVNAISPSKTAYPDVKFTVINCEDDAQPPVMNSVKIDKHEVTVGDTVTVTVAASDEHSISSIEVGMRIDGVLGSGKYITLSGNGDGTYSGQLNITEKFINGEYYLEYIRLEDAVGNVNAICPSKTAYPDAKFTVYSDFDAPELDASSLTISTPKVTIGETERVYFKASDASGIKDGFATYLTPKTKEEKKYSITYDSEKNRYYVDIPISDYTQSGKWILKNITMNDNLVSTANIVSSEVDSTGQNTVDLSAGDFEVVNTIVDSIAPVIDFSSVSIISNQVNLNGNYCFHLSATDNLSGIDTIKVNYKKPNGEIFTCNMTLDKDNVYEGKIAVSDNQSMGKWNIQSIVVTDVAGNKQEYTSLAGKWNFTVMNAYQDINPLEGVTCYISNQTVTDTTINGDVYIGPNAVVTLSNVIVTGNIYVLGGLRGVSITANGLYGQSMSFGYYGTFYNGTILLSGTNVIDSVTCIANPVTDIPMRIDNPVVSVDGYLNIKGTIAPVADLSMNGTLVNVNVDGKFYVNDLYVGNADSITLQITTIFGNTITKTIPIKKYAMTESGNLNAVPEITAENVNYTANHTYNLLENICAYDDEDGNLSDKVTVISNNLDITKCGSYNATYAVTDSQGATVEKTIMIQVFKLADVTMDNDINIFDILEIQRYILGITTFTDHMMSAADVTGDGEVNIFDILAIQRHILGIQLIAE